MTQTNKPFYSQAPIRDLETLARVVNLELEELLHLAKSSGRMYRRVPQRKKDGSTRETWDARPKLKRVQGLIKSRILEKVVYPRYLHGGIRDPDFPRDYARNAAIHVGQALLINEDVTDFFPSTTAARVHEIFRDVFRFSEDVASCLTELTTRKGQLPQGARTSNHLANLAFHRAEYSIVEYFKSRGIRYSRLTDDITISARRHISPAEKTRIIATIYGMLHRAGYRPKRSKHKLFTRRDSMLVNNLVVNARVSLPELERKNIRAEAQRLVGKIASSAAEPADPRVTGRIGKLGRFHPRRAAVLKQRLAAAQTKSKSK